MENENTQNLNSDNTDSNNIEFDNLGFEKLQQVWQEQKTDQNIFNQEKINDMIQQIEKKRKQIFKENVAVSLQMIPAFAVFAWIFVGIPDRSVLFYAIPVMMTVLILAMLAFLWSRSVNWGSGTISKDNQAFVDQTVKKLKFGKVLMNIVVPAYSLILCVLMNLYMNQIFNLPGVELGSTVEILAHILFTIAIIAFVAFTLSKKRKEYNLETQPIVDSLEDWKKVN